MPQNQSARAGIWAGAVDRAGVIASTACLIHCLVTPVVLSLSVVYAHFLPSEEHTHRVLAVFIATLGALAIVFGYRRHRRSSVLTLMSIGMVLIFAGAFFGDRLPSHAAEVLVTLAGSCCLIAAHRKNHTFCQSCTSCDM
jgi:uncharacterized membrane protein YfcA